MPWRRPSVTDWPLYRARASASDCGQPGERPARVGRLEARSSAAWRARRPAPGPAAGRSDRRSLRVPAAASRRISRSSMVLVTIGSSQDPRSWNRASTASDGRSPAFASIAHQSRSGMWMSRASSSCASNWRDDRQSSRRPAAASPSRRAGCGPRRRARSPRAGPASRPRAVEVLPASQSSRAVQSRTYGFGMLERLERSRLVQAADQVQRPERLEGRLPGLRRRSGSSARQRPTASLRSPISRRAVWRIQRFGSDEALDQLDRRETSSRSWRGFMRRSSASPSAGRSGRCPGRSAPRGCGSG